MKKLIIIGIFFLAALNLHSQEAPLSVVREISGTYDIVNYYEVMKNGDLPEMADLHVKAAFADFQVLYIHNLTHGELWRHISRKENSIYRQMMIEFIQSHIEG
ncbi:MAG: hypothetical protein SF052_04120 [Bacteroidia bacterium]|nr:hypothetical protein [Bacteroidia bacterium]